MRHHWLSGTCLAAALAACSPDPDAVGRPMTPTADPTAYLVPSDPCGAGRLRKLVGQNAAALNAAPLPAEYRIVYPWNDGGGAFQAERLTVTVDASTTITRITCG
jgi:hypothetical protein